MNIEYYYLKCDQGFDTHSVEEIIEKRSLEIVTKSGKEGKLYSQQIVLSTLKSLNSRREVL